MFAESVVLRKLDQFEQKHGWRPVPHAVEDCDRMVKHFTSEGNGGVIVKSRTGNIDLQRPLSKGEKKWIANERAMCAIDCGYYLTHYYWIQSEANEQGGANIMHFRFRSGQRVFYNILQKLDEMGVSKEIFCLKARKQGISTLIEGIMSWGALFLPGVKAAIASADGQKSQIMAGMFFFAIDEVPWWMEADRTRDKRASDRGIIEWSHIGSQVILQSGSMRGGIGQGTTPNFVHISEASQFTDAIQQIDEGLLKAVTSNPNTVMVIETTGDGDDWTRKMWEHCKKNYWHGTGARLLPLFLPWFMTPEIYPSDGWLKKFPMPADFESKRIPETVAMVAKCQAYVAATEVLQIVLGKHWKLPMEQQWWWQFTYLEHKNRGIEKSFTRQHPCDDFEALIGDNDKAIGEEAVENMNRTVTQECGIYMIAGEGIETKHEPPEQLVIAGEDALRLYSEWTTHKGEKLNWGFIPVAGDTRHEEFDPLKRILVFEEPRPGFDYGIGCDTGTGVELDRSSIIVTRKGEEEEPDVQVAEFADDTIGNTELYAWLAAITSLYSRYMTEHPHPKLAIEMRRKFGDMSFHQMRLMGFHRHHDFVPLDRKTFRPVSGKAGRPGWWTNAWSRPMLLGFFTASVENGWYEVRSRYLAQEIKEAEMKVMKSGATRMDHVSGKHDDRIFGAAMSHFTLHPAEVLAEWSKRRYNAGSKGPLEIDFSPAAMIAQNCPDNWLTARSGRSIVISR
jgi:hypothetical protein